jgi:hypothetical protein
MNAEELALQLVQHVSHDELKAPLEQNYRNVQELMRTIQDLQKQLYNKQRDIDVLHFELANYKPDMQQDYDYPDPLTIDDNEDFI